MVGRGAFALLHSRQRPVSGNRTSGVSAEEAEQRRPSTPPPLRHPRLGGSGQGGQLGGNWVRMSSEGNEFCVEERSALERPRLPPVPIAPELLGARSAKVGQMDETHDAPVGRRDEPIHLRPYDTRWPVLFEQEAAALRALIAPWITGGIHHVGSTANPGLAAKPSPRTMRRSSASLRAGIPTTGRRTRVARRSWFDDSPPTPTPGATAARRSASGPPGPRQGSGFAYHFGLARRRST